ncbi:hypothetical protein AAF712_008633 [Marasmius tenuissimus]|uniref:Uncharacterized protein n=1 Tax=Marasmius tenuissimus TaxID=585030 RepID=A0ABR2ZTR6_9AGAR
MMVASKALTALALVLAQATVPLAAPSHRQITDASEPPDPKDRINCTYVMTPDPPVVDDRILDRYSVFAWTIGRQIAVDSPTRNGWVFRPIPLPWVHNKNGSYTVNATAGSRGLSADELKKIVTDWQGKFLPGAFEEEWEVEYVGCLDFEEEEEEMGMEYSLQVVL